MNSIVIESIYNLINSKKIQELEIVLNWFEKGEYKKDKEVKTQLKEALIKKPVSLNDVPEKEKELLKKIFTSIK